MMHHAAHLEQKNAKHTPETDCEFDQRAVSIVSLFTRQPLLFRTMQNQCFRSQVTRLRLPRICRKIPHNEIHFVVIVSNHALNLNRGIDQNASVETIQRSSNHNMPHFEEDVHVRTPNVLKLSRNLNSPR
jgi:hypothetical protein